MDTLPPLVLRSRKRKAEFRNIRVYLGQYYGKEVPFVGWTHSPESSGNEGKRKERVSDLFQSSKLKPLLDYFAVINLLL